MGYSTKIATCCYCASKTMLQIEKGRHELSCASCGAPLKHMKMLPKPATSPAAISHQPAIRQFAKAAKLNSSKPKRAKKKSASWKKRKSWLRDFAEEAFDFVEDVFD